MVGKHGAENAKWGRGVDTSARISLDNGYQSQVAREVDCHPAIHRLRFIAPHLRKWGIASERKQGMQ